MLVVKMVPKCKHFSGEVNYLEEKNFPNTFFSPSSSAPYDRKRKRDKASTYMYTKGALSVGFLETSCVSLKT